MPDPPLAPKRAVTLTKVSRPSSLSRYAELHCKTNFSFLEGASHPDELVQQGVALGLRALAITDRNSLAGVVRAHVAAKACELPLIIGAEITPEDADPVVLLATNRSAYGRLSRLITLGRRRATKGECLLYFEDIAAHADGLLAGVLLDPIASVPRLHQKPASSCLGDYRDLFRDRCYAFAELRRGDDDLRRLEGMHQQATAAGVPLVAAGDVHYHMGQRKSLHDVLTCIRAGCTLAEVGELVHPNAERHLCSYEEMLDLFSNHADAVYRTVEIAERCSFSLDELRYEYPEELCPAGQTPTSHLRQLTWQGARERYPQGVPDRIRALIEHELGLITELRYEAYFLTVHDLVKFARSREILCQGRGSAANSVVCYCLGVTAADPDKIDMLFERFVSKERDEAPDIDIDFEHERREEVLQYLYDKYGRDRAAMTAEVITYRPRSAIRDVGKALGFSLDRLDSFAKNLSGYWQASDEGLSERCREVGLDPNDRVVRDLLSLATEIIGFPRHLSQHVGGMVITQGCVEELVPIENAAMPGRTVIEWDKDDLDSLGILKVDCLALGMLTAIRKGFDLIAQHHGKRWELHTVPPDDTEVYGMVQRADTIGVFQIESRAQMSMLPRLKPACYYDLVIEVAIVRPGPIQGKMVHPYLRRRAGEEPIVYPSPACEAVLKRTFGVPIFQEQAMRLVIDAAGFTAGEADQLRRAMAAWRKKGTIDVFRDKLITGFTAHGMTTEMAERVFEQLRGFGEYGFPESHAASFAILVYVSAWMKYHYPAPFAAAILNSQPMGFYAPAQLVRDAHEHGVEVRPTDVNRSQWDCTLESTGDPNRPALRLGFRLVLGLSLSHAERITAARRQAEFRSPDDLARRASLDRPTVAKLARADAFQSLALDRRQALWDALLPPDDSPLFAEANPASDEPMIELPRLSDFEEVAADYRFNSLSLRRHPLSFLRTKLDGFGVVPSKTLAETEHGSRVRVAGLVLLRQQPGTAKGVRFMTLEDESGIANLVIFASVWERFRHIAVRSTALIAHGTLERQGIIIHVVVDRIEALAAAVHEVRIKSRDFR